MINKNNNVFKIPSIVKNQPDPNDIKIKYDNIKKKVDERKQNNENTTELINLHNSFSIISEDKEKAKELETNYLKQHLIQVNDIINKQNESSYIDPNNGYPIANATPERVWFSQNVFLVFATGAVFDKNDKQLLNEIYSYFDDKSEEYLACKVKTYSYETDFIKKLEQTQAIANGNYHICCFVVVYADKDNLENAPEKLFSFRGVVEHLISHTEIRDEMIRLMTNYGFSKVVQYQPSAAKYIGRNDANTLPDTKLQYNSNIEYDSATARELFSNMKSKESIVGTRTRINGNVNGLRSYPRRYKNKNAGYRGDQTKDKIDNDNYISYYLPTDKLGVSVKINDPLQTRINNIAEKDQMQVYDLYDNNDDKNIIQIPDKKRYN